MTYAVVINDENRQPIASIVAQFGSCVITFDVAPGRVSPQCIRLATSESVLILCDALNKAAAAVEGIE